MIHYKIELYTAVMVFISQRMFVPDALHSERTDRRIDFLLRCVCVCVYFFCPFQVWNRKTVPIKPRRVSDFCRDSDLVGAPRKQLRFALIPPRSFLNYLTERGVKKKKRNI